MGNLLAGQGGQSGQAYGAPWTRMQFGQLPGGGFGLTNPGVFSGGLLGNAGAGRMTAQGVQTGATPAAATPAAASSAWGLTGSNPLFSQWNSYADPGQAFDWLQGLGGSQKLGLLNQIGLQHPGSNWNTMANYAEQRNPMGVAGGAANSNYGWGGWLGGGTPPAPGMTGVQWK